MALLRSDFTRMIVSDGIDLFWKEYDEVDPVWQGLFREQRVNEPLTRRASMIGMGDLLEKKEAEPFSFDRPSLGWDYAGRTRTFGRGFEFSMENYEDTQVRGLFMQLVADLAQSYPRTRDRFYARVFNNGALLNGDPIFNASIPGVYVDPTGNFVYDGKPFFAAAGNAHPLKVSSEVIQNYFALPLTHDNLISVWQHIVTKNNRDENGNKIYLRPDTIVVPPALTLTALEILDTKLWPDRATTPSVSNPAYRKFQIVEWPHLDDDDGWFLVERGRGLFALNRREVTIDMWIDQETQTYKALCHCRFGFMCDDVRYTTACNIQQS